jgi:putative hydrolase of the HAD superfamily
MRFMTVNAVIFDWGGTLTPWHTIDHQALWRAVCAPHFPAADAAALGDAVAAAEAELWRQSESAQRSATLAGLLAGAGVTPTAALLDGYFRAWDPHTYTDPEVAPLFRLLRARGIRVGVLSNTMWPRSAHERVFARDEVLTLIDGAVYSSEIPWTKPHPEAFRAAMAAIGETDPAACVFVGDRPFDDIFGASRLGMRTVLIPHSGLPPHEGTVPDAVIGRLAELPALLEQW